MREDLRCPVRIEHEQRSLSAQELVQIGHSADTIPLTFINDLGEYRRIVFHPNSDFDKLRKRDLNKGYSKCHFEGFLDDDHSAISICSLSQLGGILTINGRRFVLVPEVNGTFSLLPLSTDDCVWGSRQKRDADFSHTAEYYSKYLDGKWRYVELALIADYSVYEKYEKNETVVHERLDSIANYVNSLYQPLNIRVVLVWADIWTSANPIEMLSNSDQTLSNFLNFRKGFLKAHPHDNAHLLTDIRFDNSVVGKAFKGTMCSYDYSGGVDMDHNSYAPFVAATVAHEMGHNFGMDHDTSYTDCRCPAKGCIMSPSTGNISPTYWSECSVRYLQNSLSRGTDYCLHNTPSTAFGGARCGNGIVEAGEECDCGSVGSCINKCCDPKTCKLAEKAQCASGECCNLETCQVKSATTLCRDATNTCDLPEFCDGQMEHCPADFFVQDGLKCPDYPTDFCFDGRCGSRDNQCKFIWGPTGSNAASACYELNVRGDSAGNCGHDQQEDRFFTCSRHDAQCGRLHCNHANEKLAFGDPSSVYNVYTALRLSTGEEIACRVIWTKYVGGKKEPDPGMVPNGAYCGPDQMCVDAKCQNRTERVKLSPKCDPESCNNAGICNNMGNCHCKPGYGGTDCGIPGPGGSVNSGPASEGSVIHVGLFVFCLILAIIVAFVIATVLIKRKKNVWLHKQIWLRVKKILSLQRLLVPVRKAPPPPAPAIRTADLSAVWGDSATDSLSVSRPSPPSFSPPIIPSGSFDPIHATPSVARSTSFRPKEAPPKIPLRPDEKSLNALYEERGDELKIGTTNAGIRKGYDSKVYATPPADDDYCRETQKLSRTESTNRPVKPPPPPPHSSQNVDTRPKNGGADVKVDGSSKNVKAKPVPPSKPAVAVKPKVKDIAARFDPKSSQLSTDFV